MEISNSWPRFLAFLSTLVLSISLSQYSYSEVIEIQFEISTESGSDTERTLDSLKEIQDPGGICSHGLYLITHYGNLEELLQSENRKMIEKCWRYRSLSNALEKSDAKLDWNDGLKMLQNVAQIGTSWSVIYIPTGKELYFSVYQNWDVVYHLTMPRSIPIRSAASIDTALSLQSGRPGADH